MIKRKNAKQITGKEALNRMRGLSFNYNECFGALEDDLEVLDIIIKKRVNMSLIYFQKDYLDYNDHIVRMAAVTASKTLTKAEFDLIKERLKND